MKKLIKQEQWVMLPAKEQINQINRGELFINDSRIHSWGKLQALRCERVTNHGHAWNGDGIQTYINHLYLTSDEEIKAGDWCLFFDSLGNLFTDRPQQYKPEEGHVLNDGLKKIIATTDKSLGCIRAWDDLNKIVKCGKLGEPDGVKFSIAHIPEWFIKYYVEKQGEVGDVEIEYGEFFNRFEGHGTYFELTTNNNKIVIDIPKVEKKMYSRDEVIGFAFNAVQECKEMEDQETEDWIKENL